MNAMRVRHAPKPSAASVAAARPSRHENRAYRPEKGVDAESLLPQDFPRQRESALKKSKKGLPVHSSRRKLSQNLQAARMLLGWSQEQLGLQSGLKRTYIGALERREINPGIDNVDKLAAALGVPGSVLLADPEIAYAELHRRRHGR
jgi:ribosome-binding protein aMBF1 (putative translation factor)